MKSQYCLVLFTLLVASCSNAPSANTVQTAIAQTQIAQPTNTSQPEPTATLTPEPTYTPTLIPLSEIDLEPVLFMPGDLSSEYKMGEYYKEFPGLIFFKMTDFPKSDTVTSLDIDDTLRPNPITGYTKNRISVVLYDNLTQRDADYERLIAPGRFGDFPIDPLENVGEKAVTTGMLPTGYDYVIFIRCNALVFMQTTDDTANYAQRLDERLTPLVCR